MKKYFKERKKDFLTSYFKEKIEKKIQIGQYF